MHHKFKFKFQIFAFFIIYILYKYAEHAIYIFSTDKGSRERAKYKLFEEVEWYLQVNLILGIQIFRTKYENLIYQTRGKKRELNCVPWKRAARWKRRSVNRKQHVAAMFNSSDGWIPEKNKKKRKFDYFNSGTSSRSENV